MLDELKQAVCQANLDLVKHHLITLTWGNASGIDCERGLVVIKASGVPYDAMTPADMAVVDLSGNPAEGTLRPSSDTPTHLVLYRAWPEVGGIVHTHSTCAAAFAQACRPVPCLGTTHADVFRGEVPVTRPLTPAEAAGEYEVNTGKVIVERFTDLDRHAVPGVLVANHGPFTWAADVAEAVTTAAALEEVSRMALATLQIRPDTPPLPEHLLAKHHSRKHGPDAYYGQE